MPRMWRYSCNKRFSLKKTKLFFHVDCLQLHRSVDENNFVHQLRTFLRQALKKFHHKFLPDLLHIDKNITDSIEYCIWSNFRQPSFKSRGLNWVKIFRLQNFIWILHLFQQAVYETLKRSIFYQEISARINAGTTMVFCIH